MNVLLEYSKYPEILQSGTIIIDDTHSLKIGVDTSNSLLSLELIDTSLGEENKVIVAMNKEMAKDLYSLLFKLLNQEFSI